MAQVAQDAQSQASIEHYLDHLIRSWEGVPLDAEGWEEWDKHSRFAYGFDWGVPENRLHQLQGWAEQRLLTPAQQARYEQRRELVTRYRPLLEKLLEGESR